MITCTILGFLIIFIVYVAAKPYSKYQGPYMGVTMLVLSRLSTPPNHGLTTQTQPKAHDTYPLAFLASLFSPRPPRTLASLTDIGA